MGESEDSPAEAEPPRQSIMEAWRFWAPRALLEAGLIVLSLLLALWLSDWQERRRIDQDVAETRQALIEEIQANREMLASDHFVPHHLRLQGTLQQTLNTSDDLPALREGAFALYRTGIHLPELRDTAWRTATTTGIVQHMDREELEMLTGVYGAQDALTRSVTAFYPHLLQLPHHANNAESLQGAMVSVMMFMGDLTSGEYAIMQRQTQALVTLGVEAEGAFSPPAQPTD